jgi:uncharacterized protein YecE (DUF72 family)
MSILIGTSGFSYDDWRGHFYPRDLKRADMLAYYARTFGAVELNTTYYGIPKPGVMQEMTRRVPDAFEFVVKAHADMTHGEDLRPEVFAQFREAVEPLREARMLGGVLAQFPWSFRHTPENEAYLRALRDQLPDLRIIVEFRNSAWIRDETFELLRRLRLGYCCVDEPRLKGLLPPIAVATSSVGYVRFHGRNYQKWWQHDQPHERYDYKYSAEELAEWVPKIQQLDQAAQTTYVFFNNHYEGKAGQNALDLAQMLHLPLPDFQRPQESLPEPEADLARAEG